MWFDPWVGKIPWRRAQEPTPGFLPGESQGQRSLAGYSPQGCKELDMTEATNTFTYLFSGSQYLYNLKVSSFSSTTTNPTSHKIHSLYFTHC